MKRFKKYIIRHPLYNPTLKVIRNNKIEKKLKKMKKSFFSLFPLQKSQLELILFIDMNLTNILLKLKKNPKIKKNKIITGVDNPIQKGIYS